MEHLLLQHLNVAAHEQHYFTPAPTSAFLATHQDLAVSSRGEQHLAAERASASRAAAARARLAQAAQVRAAQQTHLRSQEQDFTAWLAKMPLNTNADEVTLSPLPEQNEGSSSHLQLKPELSAKLSTFPPKAAQITCACKCLRSHPIALVAPEQQALAHQRTRTEQLSCDYQALVLTYLKPAERPAFYNMCLSSVTALNGLTNHQLIEQAAAHYAPITLRNWAYQFTGAPEDQLTRAWNLADLSHFECCDYELPQQPKAYDVKRTCLALSERAQCVTLEAQQAINDLSLSISRMQPRHLGSALTKINPLFQLDGVGFIQGLAELGRFIPQHYPLVPLMAPGITERTTSSPPNSSLRANCASRLSATMHSSKQSLSKHSSRPTLLPPRPISTIQMIKAAVRAPTIQVQPQMTLAPCLMPAVAQRTSQRPARPITQQIKEITIGLCRFCLSRPLLQAQRLQTPPISAITLGSCQFCRSPTLA